MAHQKSRCAREADQLPPLGAAHNNADGMQSSRPFLLLTRPEPASQAFLAALSDTARASVEVLINPLLSIQVVGSLPSFEGAKGLICTSANALDAFQQLGGSVTDMPVIAVGEMTAARAKGMGFSVLVAGGTADRLVQFVLDQGIQGPLVHLRGEVSIGHVAQRLTKHGVTTTEAILYEQRLERLRGEIKAALSQDRPTIAPVFSPRTARRLGDESVGMEGIEFAAISQAVADALPGKAELKTRIADTPSRASMVKLVEEMISDAVTLERPAREM